MAKKTETPTETPAERFKRRASARTNTVLKKLKILGNCSNRQWYEYSQEDIEKIFSAIEKRVEETRKLFYFPDEDQFKL
jgi:hypothetical protein